ncbi:MAG: MarR family transcriptional regulator [Pseudomonadota bacterium]
MRRLHAALNADAPRFDHHRVGPVGGMILLTISDEEPARPSAIVDRLGRDKSQITRLLQLLETKGLISRQPDPGDRRATRLILTERGRETVVVLQDAIARALDALLAPLDKTERATLQELLGKL